MAAKLTIGFLGAGKMATALAKGFVQARLVTPKQIIASDVIEVARKAFAQEVDAKITASNTEVVKFADVLFVAVKPDQIPGLLGEIKDSFTSKHLLVSIAAWDSVGTSAAATSAAARVTYFIDSLWMLVETPAPSPPVRRPANAKLAFRSSRFKYGKSARISSSVMSDAR